MCHLSHYRNENNPFWGHKPHFVHFTTGNVQGLGANQIAACIMDGKIFPRNQTNQLFLEDIIY